MAWIDIKKALPSYEEKVLLCVEGDQTQKPPPRRLEIGWRTYTNKSGEWFNVSGYVTHWALEPELPAR